MPPRPRKHPIGLFPLSRDKRTMSRLQKGPSLAELQKRAKNRSLLHQPIESASRAAQFSNPADWVGRFAPTYKRRYPVQEHAPHFQVVSPQSFRRIIADSRKTGSPLFTYRSGKIRRLRSEPRHRHARTRLVNQKILPLVTIRDQLSAENARIRKHVHVNGFRSMHEMAGAFRAIKLVAENNVKIAEAKLKIASIRKEFVEGENKEKRLKKAEVVLASLPRSKQEWERARDHVNQLAELKGYIRNYSDSEDSESVYAERAFQFFVTVRDEKNPSKKSRLNREWLNERVRLHEARENKFLAEMKIAKLCGLHLKGRSIEGIKKDIQDAQRVIKKSRRELGKDDS